MSVRRFPALGCIVEVGGATAREAEAIQRIFQARDRQFSRFREDSELTRVNRKPHEIVTVSKTFGQMVERALVAADRRARRPDARRRARRRGLRPGLR